MKKIGYLFFSLFALGLCFTACDDSETYADLKKKERRAIQSFIEKNNIKVITESQFEAQDSTTNVAENEYVLFNDNGIYMQIVEKGEGEKMKNGDWKEIIVRFWEVYVETGDTTAVSNQLERQPDIFMCQDTNGSFTGSFTSGNMLSTYGSTLPESWLMPLSYVNLSRTANQKKLARVKMIVPHSMGNADAISSVYPCFYEITYKEK